MLGWKVAFGLVLPVNAVALLILAFVLVPKSRPDEPTEMTYRSWLQQQSAGQEVLPASNVPSVLTWGASAGSTAAEASAAPVASLRIEKVGVDARVVAMGLTPQGAMAVPDDPELVAWYEFTGKPGLGGNAVLSGHLDWANYGPAVFARLKDLVPGDSIVAVLSDGTEVQYEVTASDTYPANSVPMADVVAPTVKESLHLITCAGTFHNGDYSHRLVVRAVRVDTKRS